MYNAKGKIEENDLFEQHRPLVRRVALHMRVQLPASVDLEDMIQGGYFGLMDAIKRFDPKKGIPFEAYAKLRIRGAIIDEIRKLDWVPRRYRRMAREIGEAVSCLSKALGRKPEEREVADYLGMSLKEYQEWLAESHNGVLISYDEVGHDGIDEKTSDRARSPLEELIDSNRRELVVKAIANLDERERLALGMYYMEEMNLKEIGLALGVGESRACQLHTRAVARLRAVLAAA